MKWTTIRFGRSLVKKIFLKEGEQSTANEPGIDFNESFVPVINDVRFRIILIAMIMWGFQASLIDVETAFLNGKLSEEIYMNAPNGMNIGNKNVYE